VLLIGAISCNTRKRIYAEARRQSGGQDPVEAAADASAPAGKPWYFPVHTQRYAAERMRRKKRWLWLWRITSS